MMLEAQRCSQFVDVPVIHAVAILRYSSHPIRWIRPHDSTIDETPRTHAHHATDTAGNETDNLKFM
jgi:hypothetical protein